MDMAKSAVIFFMMMMALCEVYLAAVHKVGDSTGWTVIGHIDYQKWAASKNFHVGDTIVFEYNNNYHNVMRVNHWHFKSCNVTSPIAIYTSVSDKITIKRSGHYYFMCGFPHHCDAGQKVNIEATRALKEDIESMSLLSFPAPTKNLAMAPSPAQSRTAPPINDSNFCLALVVLAFVLAALLINEV